MKTGLSLRASGFPDQWLSLGCPTSSLGSLDRAFDFRPTQTRSAAARCAGRTASQRLCSLAAAKRNLFPHQHAHLSSTSERLARRFAGDSALALVAPNPNPSQSP
eukprot:647813-Rhodomonas_salina.1